MSKIVTYLGRPGRSAALILPNMPDPWSVGESRLFDDAFANLNGFDSGDDFAVFFTHIYNAGRGEDIFSMTDPPKPDDAPPGDTPPGDGSPPSDTPTADTASHARTHAHQTPATADTASAPPTEEK